MGNTIKRQLFFIVALALNNGIMGQVISTDTIIGQYRLPSSDPQGGESVLIFSDNTFLTVYFGGMLKGSWQIKSNTVLFKTTSSPQVVVYGREISSLKDTTQIDLSGFSGNQALVGFESGKELIMQSIFNTDANCFASPYIYKTLKELPEFSFAMGKPEIHHESEYNTLNLYSYANTKQYNDFMVVNLPSEYTRDIGFSANYVNGKLFFRQHLVAASKKPLSEGSDEDSRFIRKFMEQELLPDILEYGNEFFPYIENPTEEDLKAFYRIEPTQVEEIQKNEIKHGATSLFHASCD